MARERACGGFARGRLALLLRRVQRRLAEVLQLPLALILIGPKVIRTQIKGIVLENAIVCNKKIWV